MDESRRDPREDIFLIRQMLERATDDMKQVAPWFTAFGVLWLIYGALSAAGRVAMSRLPLSAGGMLSMAGSVAGWLFYLVLVAGFVICRRKRLDTLSGKLIDIWGVCIITFLALTLLTGIVVPALGVRVLGVSQSDASALYRALALCRSFLFFLLPVAPLLITAQFLGMRKMLWAGIILSLLTAVVLGTHALMLFAGSADIYGQGHVWTAATCLLDLVPGVMLLVFGFQLKKE